MKLDIDTILYIVISIIIIAASSLGRKKRKPAQQVPLQEREEAGDDSVDLPVGQFAQARALFKTISEPMTSVSPGWDSAEDSPLEQIFDEEELIEDEEELIMGNQGMIPGQQETIMAGMEAPAQDGFREEGVSPESEEQTEL